MKKKNKGVKLYAARDGSGDVFLYRKRPLFSRLLDCYYPKDDERGSIYLGKDSKRILKKRQCKKVKVYIEVLK